MRMSPGEVVFGVVSGENVFKLCPRQSGLPSSYLTPLGTIIGVPGKVVYLFSTTVYCAYLSVVLVPFRSGLLKLSRMATLLEKSYSFCSSSVLSENVLLCFMYFLSHPLSMLGL